MCGSDSYLNIIMNDFPVWLKNRLISGRLEPVLSHTEKSRQHRITDNIRPILNNNQIRCDNKLFLYFIENIKDHRTGSLSFCKKK